MLGEVHQGATHHLEHVYSLVLHRTENLWILLKASKELLESALLFVKVSRHVLRFAMEKGTV